MRKPKPSQPNEFWVIVERHLLDAAKPWPTLFGPFADQDIATDWCHRRIMLLASEWDASEGILTEHLDWKIEKIYAPQ